MSTASCCFYYRLLFADGRVRRGVTRLGVSQPASARLYLEQRRNAVVLSVRRLPGWLASLLDVWRSLSRGSIRPVDLAEFFRSLAVMLRGGVPLMEGLDELSRDDGSAPVAALAADVREHLRSGLGFARSLEEHADVIPETVLNLARIGEESGTLDVTMTRAAEHLARMVRIGKDSRRALIYPAFVLSAVMGAAFFWLYYVVPNLMEMFRQMGVQLPWLTLAVMHVADAVRRHATWIAIGAPLLIVAGAWILRRNSAARALAHHLAWRAPISRVLVRSSALAFITEYLSLMLAAGVDVVRSLEVLERAVRHETYRRGIAAVRAGVLQGNSLSESMRETGLFSGFMVRMVNMGEQTGTLDEQLAYLADEYRHRFEHVVTTIGELIQPAVMVLVGGLFILMVGALFLPIYQIIGHVGMLR